MYAAESDPLCYPGTTVLRNLLDLDDQADLDEAELALTLTRFDEPMPAGDLDTTHYLAVLIGRIWRDFVSIVVPPSGCDNIRIYSLRYDSAFGRRVPMRRAVFRALRRGWSAATVQRSNRRGALFHRTDGASSQAIERGPAVC